MSRLVVSTHLKNIGQIGSFPSPNRDEKKMKPPARILQIMSPMSKTLGQILASWDHVRLYWRWAPCGSMGRLYIYLPENQKIKGKYTSPWILTEIGQKHLNNLKICTANFQEIILYTPPHPSFLELSQQAVWSFFCMCPWYSAKNKSQTRNNHGMGQ